MYLAADWGMGEPEAQLTRSQRHFTKVTNEFTTVTTEDLLRRPDGDEDGEIALHPLSNQVRRNAF